MSEATEPELAAAAGTPSTPGHRRAILVLGPHRSGTSVVTRGLVCGGVHLGTQLLESNADNPKGFFENARIVGFNDRLLRHLGLCWDYVGLVDWNDYRERVGGDWRERAAALIKEEFPTAPDIAIKDPRLCLLAPFWQDVLQASDFRVQYVLVVRHPIEAAQSQCTRHQRDPLFHHVGATLVEGLLLWANYMQAALAFLSDKPFYTAAYADFFSHPETALVKLLGAFGIEPPRTQVETFVGDFIDEALRRHHAAVDVTDEHKEVAPYLAAYEALREPDFDVGALSQQLRTAMRSDPGLFLSLQRTYVQARHSSVEANLELAKAGKIIAYQEWALADVQKRLAASEQLLLQIKEEFIAERREKERLALVLAAQQDKTQVQKAQRRP